MKLSDIIALAKQGYSVSDVKELLSLSSSEDTDPEHQDKEVDEKTEEPEVLKDPEPEEAPKKSTPDSDKVVAIDDYKKQIDELKKQIADLQQDNVHKDVSGKKDDKSDIDILDDITRSFM